MAERDISGNDVETQHYAPKSHPADSILKVKRKNDRLIAPFLRFLSYFVNESALRHSKQFNNALKQTQIVDDKRDVRFLFGKIMTMLICSLIYIFIISMIKSHNFLLFDH